MAKRSKRLSDANVAALTPEASEYAVWDTRTPGLGVRVLRSGHKAFVYRVSRSGSSRRVTLGPTATLSVTEARDACLDTELAARANRAQEATEAPCVPLLREFVEGEWQSACYDRYKPSTRKAVRQRLNKQLLPKFGRLRLDRIHRVDIARWFDRYSETAPGGANHALGQLRQILNLAIARGLLETNPARGIKLNPKRKPIRFLSREEVCRVREALDRSVAERPTRKAMADIVRLLLLTGCRKGEIQLLRWCEVRDDGLHLTDAKTGPRRVFLNARARDILRAQPRTDSPYVFPSPRNPAMPISPNLALWYLVRRRAGVEDVRLHDLRHTFASHAVINGVPMPLVSRLLGHRNVSMTLRYAHVHDAEVEAAAERIGKAITRISETPCSREPVSRDVPWGSPGWEFR